MMTMEHSFKTIVQNSAPHAPAEMFVICAETDHSSSKNKTPVSNVISVAQSVPMLDNVSDATQDNS